MLHNILMILIGMLLEYLIGAFEMALWFVKRGFGRGDVKKLYEDIDRQSRL